MARSQILLLPRDQYFRWVRSVQKFALHFGVGITPDPSKAGNKEVVSVVIAPNAFRREGDIVQWLKTRFPKLMIDVIHANSPEKLAAILDERIDIDTPYKTLINAKNEDKVVPRYPKDRLYLFWPTDYPTILQPFGANSELYVQYGLPGHEGIDIRAPHNTNVYACADGEVYLVEDGRNQHNYGKQVRIRHEYGYRTIYAHLERILVNVGDKVRARQLIGRADSSGNSSGNHLHLTLKKDQATANGETNYPLDIIDPTPFLVYKHQEVEVMETLGMTGEAASAGSYGWTQPCLVGINTRQGGTMQEVDFAVLREARIEAVRVSAHTPAGTLNRLRELIPDVFLLGTMTARINQENRSPQRWVEEMYAEFLRLYRAGVRYFQIQESPNRQQSGWRTVWSSGEGFGRWWLAAVELLKEEYPEARMGFPGVSVGGHVPGQRLAANVFLEGADQAMIQADWLGATCYWKSEAEMNSRDDGRFYEVLRERYPDKLIFITEFGNINAYTNPVVKGREYVKFYRRLREYPGVGAAFAQIVSAARGYDALVWRSEDGKANRIGKQVGERNFS
ncbi:MAG: M23 family metallopeptidase [Anaerolineales bacterium]|jgi:murein DD-endopeptidase MepM/ murein hydrolase activator NlpD